MYSANLEILTRVHQEVKEARGLTPAIQAELEQIFGEKVGRALEAIQANRIKKYTFRPSQHVAWIVVGKNRDYEILPRLFCMCDDFYLNVAVRKTEKTCYHLLAQTLAEAMHSYDSVESEDEKLQLYTDEWSKPSVDALIEKLKKR